ncbi:hypothetical protein [Amphritea japonica]|uniref:Rap1a immunity protein domain-containing protein n=1 Tax=Amphritea japonica ATCC BAA-1530 TaxID=1278309 RepID=A0A7R6PGA9_9GAMM|nr:hypothetical protein [Amphritea japonica]BBB25932.1 hypothetical protein AMJAP_1337 [Amphritea japonica ATCC BAA-1530]
MKFIYGLLVATLVMSPLLASESEIETKYHAFGMGVTKCVEVNENIEKEEFQFVLKVWLTGYMTAVNSILNKHSIGLSGPDIGRSIEAIRSYCTVPSNEQGSISEAAETYWRGRINEMTTTVAQ